MYILNEYECNSEFDEKRVATPIAKALDKMVDWEGFKAKVSCVGAHIK